MEDMSQLSKKNRELLSLLGEGADSDPDLNVSPDVSPFQAENAGLRCAIAELNQLAEAGAAEAENAAAERQKEFENLLEEKSEVIRALHLKIKELQERPAVSNLPNEQELQTVCEEMERERAQLDLDRRQIEQDRAQLQLDEESLMKQMREMEMSMSRDRAELARQRNELQRLHTDIKHDLELAGRDASLRDRLEGLQRRHQEIHGRKGGSQSPEPRTAAPRPQAAPASAKPVKKKESGLLRRLFGSGK
jgi:chromosome segregation ATPase